jgi:hypothetical protein
MARLNGLDVQCSYRERDHMDQSTSQSPIVTLIYLALAVLMIVAYWKLFVKAGQPGWAIFIPIYNVIVMLKIIGRPWWWILLFLVPLVNFVIAIIVSIDLAKAFGKEVGFGIGIFLLGFIFIPILAFGDAQYKGAPAAAAV